MAAGYSKKVKIMKFYFKKNPAGKMKLQKIYFTSGTVNRKPIP